MNKKLNTLKLIALSSLIFLGTVTYNNNYKATAQQNNTTSVETVEKQESNNELAVAEGEEYKGVLKSCNRSGESVTCDVLITNKKRDHSKTLYVFDKSNSYTRNSYSRIIDINGNEYPASSIKSGIKEGRGITVNFVQGVPQKVTVSFNKIPVEVNKLALLEVAGFSFKLEFRDFAISNNR